MTASFSNEPSMLLTLVILLYGITSCSHEKPQVNGITVFLRSVSRFVIMYSHDLNKGQRIMQREGLHHFQMSLPCY